MNRYSKTTSFKVKATRHCKDRHLDFLKEKVNWVIILPGKDFTMNQFLGIIALIELALCFLIFIDVVYPFIKKMINNIKKLLRHDKDK